MVKRITALLLILLLGAPLSLLAAQVTAVADRDRISAGESLQLELQVKGSADGDPDLSVLRHDWQILSRSQSSQMQLINGSFNRALVYSLTLMPRHSGELQIPAVCFGKDCSLPLPVQVSQTSAVQDQTSPLLLEVDAQPRQALVGSQVLLTVHLLHRVDLAQASLSDPQPQGVDCEIQQLGKDRSYETRRNGYLYQAVERRYVLFPQKAGPLHLPALQLDAQVAAPPSHLDPFGQLLRPVRRFSQPLDIRVEPAPNDLVNRSWLPARELSLTDDWQQHPPALRVGEPATRTLVLKAQGLPAAHLPALKLPTPSGWKSYPDQPSREDGSDSAGIVGTLRQKIALVPTRPGDVKLPAVDLDWYDVTSRQWRRAHLDPLLVTVAPAAPDTSAPAPRPVPPPAPAQTPPAKTAPAPSPQSPPRTTTGLWPWLSLLLGLGLLVSLLLLWRQRRRPQREVVREQSETAAPVRAKDALKMVLSAVDANDPKAVRQALLAWSSCRWPAAGLQDLEQLAERCGEPLAGELVRLGQVLYGRGSGSWQGKGLAEALESWLKQQQVRPQPAHLPPLYPGSGG